jgi:tetratricopeptide (TPR) repeat protein
MSANPRIEELRRRVQADPTSIAFAALAEEYRRAGQFEEAIEACRNGLTRHPAYISARVTLGRALIELDRLDEAEAELAHVLKIAPENLAAIRAQAEIHTRRGLSAESEPPKPPAASAPTSGAFELDLIGTLPGPSPAETSPAPEQHVATITTETAAEASLPALQRFLDGILARKLRRLTAQI